MAPINRPTSAYTAPMIFATETGPTRLTIIATSQFRPLTWSYSEQPHVVRRPPAQLHLADDVLLRNRAPVAAVPAAIAVIAHHEVIAFRHDLRSEVLGASILGRHEV